MFLDLILVQCLDHEYEIIDLLVEIDINSAGHVLKLQFHK